MEDNVSSLIECLGRADKKAARQAADALISLAPQHPDLTRRLYRALNAAPRERRWPIAYVLAHISAPSAPCVEVLTETLGSGDPDLRWAACAVMARLGKSDPAIVRNLLELEAQGTPRQRRMAIYCLRSFKLKDVPSLQALLSSLSDPDPLVRLAAAISLRSRPELSPKDLDLVLDTFLRDNDPRIRYAVALTLGEVGAASGAISAALKEASQSEDARLRKAATTGLRLLERKRPAPSAK